MPVYKDEQRGTWYVQADKWKESKTKASRF